MYVNHAFGIYETEKDPQIGLDFTDITDEKIGLSLIQRETPLYSYDGKNLSLLLAPRLAGRGTKRCHYAIYSHKGNYTEGKTIQMARQFNTPLVAYPTSIHKGQLSNTHSFIQIRSSNTILTAVYPQDGSVIARVFEAHGKTANAKLSFMPMPKKISQIRLDGTKIKELAVKKGIISVRINPWKIMSFKADYI